MKSSFSLILILISSFYLHAQSNEKAINDIKQVIQTAYVEGLQNEGDIAKIDSGIHQGFNLLGIGENNDIWSLSIADWKAKVVKRKEAGELPRAANKKVSVKFLSVDVTGSAAMAKIEFYVGSKLKYVDYISLYKFENDWKMVNKIFHKMD